MTPDAPQSGGDAGQQWRVGTATRDITPERPILLAGYGDRTGRSTGVARDLRATALAVEDATGTLVVLVGLDLLGVTRDLRAAVAERCEAAHDLPPSALVLNASHTHHGPEYRVDEWRVWDADGENDERAREYRRRIEDEVVAVVGEALDDRSRADLRYSHARCGFGTNRRRPGPDGFDLAAYPDGPVDVDVPVLVASTDERVRAVAFGYACHPTARPKGTEFHPGWPGVARAHLEERFPDATAVFLQGCGADQNPYPRGEPGRADQHGRTMATAVEAAVDARGKPVRGPLRTCTAEVALRFAAQSDRAELERRTAETDGATQAEGTDGMDGTGETDGTDRTARTDRYARRLLDELDRDGEIRTEFPYRVGTVGFGTDLTLVTLGGEVPVEFARRIRGSLAGDVWVAGYTNQGYVYVPTARQLREGGYEATWVFLYWDYPAPLEPGNEARIRETALALAQRAGATRRDPPT